MEKEDTKMLKDYFIACEACFPERRSQLRRLSLALRRERINTMEQLCHLQQTGPDALLALRSIGTKSLDLIEQVCNRYESERT